MNNAAGPGASPNRVSAQVGYLLESSAHCAVPPDVTGRECGGPWTGFFRFDDECGLAPLRYDNWNFIVPEMRATGTLRVWVERITGPGLPLTFHRRTDRCQRAQITSDIGFGCRLDRAFMRVPAPAASAGFPEPFKDAPLSQRAANFGRDQVLQKLYEGVRSIQSGRSLRCSPVAIGFRPTTRHRCRWRRDVPALAGERRAPRR
jgi:hypothetical protein